MIAVKKLKKIKQYVNLRMYNLLYYPLKIKGAEWKRTEKNT